MPPRFDADHAKGFITGAVALLMFETAAAELLRQRFDMARRKLGYDGERGDRDLETGLFAAPNGDVQMKLF